MKSCHSSYWKGACIEYTHFNKMCTSILSVALCMKQLTLEVPIQQYAIKTHLTAQSKPQKMNSIKGKDAGGTHHSGLFREHLFPFTVFHWLYNTAFSLCNIPETRIHLKIASNFDWPKSKFWGKDLPITWENHKSDPIEIKLPAWSCLRHTGH